MTSRQLRLVRAGAPSAVATLVAAVSHTIGGGPAPHPLLVLAVAVLLTPPSALLIGARPSRGRVAAAVVAAQGVFHVMFQFLGAPAASPIMTGGAHTHRLELSAAPLAAAAPELWMLGAHVVAAALTVTLVWHGGSAVRRVARWVRAFLRMPAALSAVDHEAPAPLRDCRIAIGTPALASAVTRRGPPVSSRG